MPSAQQHYFFPSAMAPAFSTRTTTRWRCIVPPTFTANGTLIPARTPERANAPIIESVLYGTTVDISNVFTDRVGGTLPSRASPSEIFNVNEQQSPRSRQSTVVLKPTGISVNPTVSTVPCGLTLVRGME